LTLPSPTGPHSVGTVSLHLVDADRADPWVPTDPARNLVVQLWYPASTVHGYPAAPWLTPIAAKAYSQVNRIPELNWPITAGHIGAPVAPHRGGWPVLLYSPGLGGQRGEATALIEDLASRGYLVVTIDHVHDSNVVELPGGRIEKNAMPGLTPQNELAVTTKAIDARVADVRFVLDELAVLDHGANPDAEHRRLPRGLRGAFDEQAIGMLGHSDGGATTAAAIHDDRRIKAGINLDGTLWTPEATAASDRPFLLFGREDHDQRSDKTWSTFWAAQRGPKLQLNLVGAEHGTFHDFAVLLPQAAPLIGRTQEQLIPAVGRINGWRAVAVERRYVTAFFDEYLRHRPRLLLGGPSPNYPEVRFSQGTP
jgi:dienelactone hydrolase